MFYYIMSVCCSILAFIAAIQKDRWVMLACLGLVGIFAIAGTLRLIYNDIHFVGMVIKLYLDNATETLNKKVEELKNEQK